MYTLVFSGGSTKIPLHVGAYKAILEHGVNFNNIIGNSCGSIMAAAIATGMPYKNIKHISDTMDFGYLARQTWWKWIKNFCCGAGLVSGFRLLRLFYELFGHKRFRDVAGKFGIVGHSLKKRTYTIFSKNNYPDMEIADACRISCAIPLFFNPYVFEDDLWIDGGVSKGFPIDLVEGDVIGHLIQTPNYYHGQRLSFKGMAFSVLDHMLQQSSENSIRTVLKEHYLDKEPNSDYNINGKIIVRTTYNKPEYEFETTKNEKEEMYELGYSNMYRVLDMGC